MTDDSSYDELPYEQCAFVQAHPDRLAVVGALHGLSPAPVDGCTVLELGCALGGNLIPMAAVLPASRFLGIDLSARQIEQGREVIERLGLENVELRAQDLMDFDEGEGLFDYILCHGVYSWVPPAVQERILSICKRGLSARGLATISYNAHPGWRFKGAVRDILRYGARGAEGPARQVKQGLDFLGFVARSVFEPDSPYGRTVREAAESLASAHPTYVFHEYLEDCNYPLSFEESSRRASEAGLRYVGDADLRDPSNRLTDEARQVLTDVSDDLVRCEQTLDFLRRRTFRRDVLCHDDVAVERWPQPAAMKDMLLVALAEPVPAEPDAASDAVEQFRNARGHTLSTGDPGLKAALLLLHRARPKGVPCAELLENVRASAPQVDEAKLAQLLLSCATASLVEPHTYLPPIAGRPPDRPEASVVARRQAAGGEYVVDLRHRIFQLDDLSRAVLAMLDGQRTRRSLCDALAEQLRTGKLTIEAGPDGRQTIAPSDVQRIVNEVLDALAGLCLLIDRA